MLDERAFKIIKIVNVINKLSNFPEEKADLITHNIEILSELCGLDKEKTIKKIIELEQYIYTGEHSKTKFEIFFYKIIRMLKWQ